MSKQFIILGDVHGNIVHCIKVCEQYPNHTIVQLGDLGVGFIPTDSLRKSLPDNFKFFRGNHDNPVECSKLSHCLGDFGEHGPFFFVGGADSIDKGYRTEGISWWRDEQLTHAQANQALDQWKASKAEILITHDCPQSVAQWFFDILDSSFTRLLLETMIEARKPKLCIFGHHHKRKTFDHGGVHYEALGIDTVFPLPI